MQSSWRLCLPLVVSLLLLTRAAIASPASVVPSITILRPL